MFIFDTREQKNVHIKHWFDEHGLEYREQKLNCGDYMVEGGTCSVDRKQNLEECAQNLMNRKDHSRFWKEVRRAQEQGIKLIILVEHGENIQSMQDVARWRSKFSPVSGRALVDEMFRVQMAYGVEWRFCDKRDTGREIVRILSGEYIG